MDAKLGYGSLFHMSVVAPLRDEGGRAPAIRRRTQRGTEGGSGSTPPCLAAMALDPHPGLWAQELPGDYESPTA